MSFGDQRYSLAQHGVGHQREASLNKVLRPDVRNLYYYGLNYAENGLNVIRVWPNIGHDEHGNKVWTPFRNSLDVPMDFGDWIRRYPVARKVAGTHLTFIIGDPAREYDFSHKPINVLHDAVQSAIKAGQERPGWARLLERSSQGQLLSRSSYVYMVQCGLFQHGAKSTFKDGKGFPGVHPECAGIVMELTEAAGRSMLTLLDQRREVSADVPLDDFETRFVHGDPISWEHGRFVVFYRRTDGDPRTRRSYGAQASSVSPLGSLNLGQQAAGKIAGGYDCFIEPTVEIPGQGLINASVPPEIRPSLENKIKAWDEILYFPSDVEQAHLIAPLYPADLVMYAFSDHPDWIPESVRNAAVAAVSVPVPAGMNFGTPNPYAQREVAPPVIRTPVPPTQAAPSIPANVDKAMQQMSSVPAGFGTVHTAASPTAVPGFTPNAVVSEVVVSPSPAPAVPPAAPPAADSNNPASSGIAAAEYALNLLRKTHNQ